MSIKQAIRDELAKGPKSLRTIAHTLGLPIESIRNARNYLLADGVIRSQAGQKSGSPDILYELIPIRTVIRHGNVLTAPAWVPLAVPHRPIIDVAPGMKVRSYYDGTLN